MVPRRADRLVKGKSMGKVVNQANGTTLWIVIGMGYPRVFWGYPYPYPLKPVPTARVRVFRGFTHSSYRGLRVCMGQRVYRVSLL